MKRDMIRLGTSKKTNVDNDYKPTTIHIYWHNSTINRKAREIFSVPNCKIIRGVIPKIADMLPTKYNIMQTILSFK